MRRTTRFRQLLAAPEILQMPCCHDALSARVLEQAGFEAIAAAGFGLSGSLLGMPDIGLLEEGVKSLHLVLALPLLQPGRQGSLQPRAREGTRSLALPLQEPGGRRASPLQLLAAVLMLGLQVMKQQGQQGQWCRVGEK